jgi:Protein of unknown function (DUF_B2219)
MERTRPPIWEYATELLARIPIPPVELKSEPVSFQIEVKKLRRRLESLVESKSETVLLELEDVEAESQPGVVWEVYAGLPKGARPESSSTQYVGSLSLFGAGVRSEGHKEFKSAHFVYPLNRALQTTLKRNEQNFPITFVPVGILIDGKPSGPEVKSPVHIGKANLLVQTKRESTKKPEDMPE